MTSAPSPGVFEAKSDNAIEPAFASLVRLHAGALVVASDTFFSETAGQSSNEHDENFARM